MVDSDQDGRPGLLQNKRDATRYQILVRIAESQPSVSQKEVAESVGVTAQAVSDYLGGLVEDGFVEKHGRGRYEVTKEGVDWLIGVTEELRDFVGYVSEDVIGQVEVAPAISTAAVEEGDRVSITMRDGVMHATPGGSGSHTAVAVTAAEEGGEVGVTDFEGILDFEPGGVTAVPVPRVQNGGSQAVDTDLVVELSDEHDLIAVAGVEALVSVRKAGLEPDVRFGSVDGVVEAATKGLDVLLVTVTSRLSEHTEALRRHNDEVPGHHVGYEVVDANTD